MRQEPIETIHGKHATAYVYFDEHVTDSPREWDNLATLACVQHRRYDLGDEQFGDLGEHLERLLCEADPGAAIYLEERRDYELDCAAMSDEDLNGKRQMVLESETRYRQRLDAEIAKHYVMLPLYLYDHSGITMRTTPFSCPWDSGEIGLAYISMADARREAPPEFRHDDGAVRAWAENVIRQEVETYDDYLRGEVYCYTIEDLDGEHLDSLFGIYDQDYAIEEARRALEEHDRQQARARTWRTRGEGTTVVRAP